jgi:hypothetical protein
MKAHAYNIFDAVTGLTKCKYIFVLFSSVRTLESVKRTLQKVL